MRRSCEPLVGRVFLRTFGSTSAARISASRRSSAARRFWSWLRSLMDLNRMLPSSMIFCPASRRRRFLAATGRLVFSGSRKRSCAALATLLTFWPPGPEERMNFHSNSSSGMTMSGVMIRGMKGGSVEVRAQSFRGRGVHDDFALRHRDGDAVLLEQPPYGPVHFRAHVVHAFLGIGNPEAQLELDAAVAELHQTRDGRGFGQHAGLTFAGGEQQLQGRFRVVAVTHADG